MQNGADLTTSRKGRVAEAGIMFIAVRQGWDAYIPAGDGAKVDMVLVNPQGIALRTQVKWGKLHPSQGVIKTRLSTSRLTTRHGHVRTTYDETAIDAIAIWCDPMASAYVLPIGEVAGMSTVQLRIRPTANSQSRRVRYASDYLLGAVAQLGERSAGSRKVRGSSPLSST